MALRRRLAEVAVADFDKRNNRRHTCSVVKKTYDAASGVYEIQLFSKKYDGFHQNIQQSFRHTVYMKRVLIRADNPPRKNFSRRFRDAPPMKKIRARIAGPFKDFKTADPVTASLRDEYQVPLLDNPLGPFKSLSCTCPDWTYRGAYSKQDRGHANPDPVESILFRGVRVGVMRALAGCKHMIRAEEVIGNPQPGPNNGYNAV